VFVSYTSISVRRATELTNDMEHIPDKLARLQLVKKYLTFCGTRRFVTAFTSARHLSLF
jgi:hypothetical protein